MPPPQQSPPSQEVTLSVVVVFFNMEREARRSLYALSRAYQRGVDDLNYEVICVDNGSSRPLSQEFVGAFGAEFRHYFLETTSPTPAEALNFGVSKARGQHVTVMVDGAHVLTPGVLGYVAKSVREFADPLVAVVSLPLGAATREEQAAYDQAAEDRRLATVDWKGNGYALFGLTNSFGDAAMGWFGGLFESACVTLRKDSFDALGGFDARFQSPGGGLVSLDFFQRALGRTPAMDYVLLLGESTFHQYHGGAATGAREPADHPWQRFHDEYRALRGGDFQRVARMPVYFGRFTPGSLHIAAISAKHGFEWWRSALRP
jgi:hypothetical protein